ncbi:hypothetical protein L7F22_038178 [Adiantum nelumboides]|nr:hypothetical protein [Adiantum nelumboides]
MEDFANLVERNYGLKPQGKMAPMTNAKQPLFSASIAKPAPANPRNGTKHRSSAPILADDDPFFGGSGVRPPSSSSGRYNTVSGSDPLFSRYDDVFGGPPSAASSTHIFEDIFRPAAPKLASAPNAKEPSSYPVFDAPVYDDDIFGGMPGVRKADSAFEDVFNIGSTPAAGPNTSPASYDDLLGVFESKDAKETSTETGPPKYDGTSAGESAFEELLAGFPAKSQSSEAGKPSQHKHPTPTNGFSSNILEDPFTVLNSDNRPRTNNLTSASNFEATTGEADELSKNFSKNQNSASSVNFENDPSHSSPDLTKASAAAQSFSPKRSKAGAGHNEVAKEHKRTTSSRVKVDASMLASSAESASAGSPSRRVRTTPSVQANDSLKRRPISRESAVSLSPDSEEAPSHFAKARKSGRVDEFWLSIDDVKLVTQPTSAPPPVRPPPAPGLKQGHAQRKFSPEGRFTENVGHSPVDAFVKVGLDSADPLLDDLEAFASGSSQRMDADVKGQEAFSPGEEEQGSAAATASGAAMKEAIERAEAKLRQAKEAKDRDREEAQGMRNKEAGLARDRDDGGEGKGMHDREERGREDREREARERWRKEKEREERDKETQREREREREKDRANEIARQRAAVERANAEVREREAQKAAERAAEARIKAERVAVERAHAEARERHVRVAAEKARAERTAAAEREMAEKDRMGASRDQQRMNENDLESFFRATSRPTSAPKQRTHPTDGIPPSSEGLWRSNNSASNVKKVPSMPSMADDLTSLFGGPSLRPGTFQEVEGEPAERRKARWDRYQRTLERTNLALEEKRQRDLQSVKDQEDRHRAGELVDAEIKRWAAGKEGNLRALLSTLQYVLWPECGWQPLSLTDLITATAVKKAYKKANLYVHPDKVQQKGATNQQKYIAEKVFDLLKGAWNKFNSEELF